MSINPISSWVSATDPQFIESGGSAQPFFPVQNAWTLQTLSNIGSSLVGGPLTTAPLILTPTTSVNPLATSLPAGVYFVSLEMEAQPGGTSNAPPEYAEVASQLQFVGGSLKCFGSPIYQPDPVIGIGQSYVSWQGVLDNPNSNGTLQISVRCEKALTGVTVIAEGGSANPVIIKFARLDVS